MIYVNIVIEDKLSEAVLKKILLKVRPDIQIDKCLPIQGRKYASVGFGYIKTNLKAFNKAAMKVKQPYIVVTDLDKDICAPSLIKKWCDFTPNRNFIFRVAVRAIESWVMADKNGLIKFLKIQPSVFCKIKMDEIEDPKSELLELVKKSRLKNKGDIIPKNNSTAKIGPEYNPVFCGFVEKDWDGNEAIKHSDSLNRAIQAIKKITKFE